MSSERTPLGFRLNPLVLLPGLLASAALLADYTRRVPVFCTEAAGGCAAVRRSAAAQLAGIPTPVLGLLGLTALLVLGSLRGPLARKLHASVALLGGLAALGLLAVQASLGQYCEYCLVADASVLAAAAIGAHRWLRGWEPPPQTAPRLGRAGVVLGLTALMVYHGMTRVSPTPALIEEELANTPPGQLLVVDFVDYECPYCRVMHAKLAPLLKARGENVRVLRVQVPLKIHPHAEAAARAALCAARHGQDEAYSDRLFSLDPALFEPQTLTREAAALGIDPKAFTACLGDPSLDAELARDQDRYTAVGRRGLPTVYVGRSQFIGAPDDDELARAFAAESSP